MVIDFIKLFCVLNIKIFIERKKLVKMLVGILIICLVIKFSFVVLFCRYIIDFVISGLMFIN